MTRLTPDERAAIQLRIGDLAEERDRISDRIVELQAMLDAQPADAGDTLRFLRPLCACGLPLDHRHPVSGEPRPCADETAKIALPGRPSGKPPVPMTERAAEAIIDLVDADRRLRTTDSVTRDDSRPMTAACGRCGHRRIDHILGPCDVARGGVRVDDCDGFLAGGDR
jgi:hypothetical protein